MDGYSFVGITQDRAAEILMRTSHTVRPEVTKQAAMFHRLATLLSSRSSPARHFRSTKRTTIPSSSNNGGGLYRLLSSSRKCSSGGLWTGIDRLLPAAAHRMNSNSSQSQSNGQRRPASTQRQLAIGACPPGEAVAAAIRPV